MLRPAIIDKFGMEYYNNHIGKVDYSYNKTNGLVLDLWESLAQKLNFQELIDAIFDTSHERDLAKQVKAYENSIKDGHKVLVVAHSQGNLFTAEALNSLSSWMQNYFYAVSVASPKAFKIKGDTPHIAKIKIMNAIDGGLSKLDILESQWKINKSSKADKELLVKVMHKYDSEKIVISEDVYPFNLAKKLYQVNGEYVKASFGGTEILDSWESQKENEFYYLEGTGEIIAKDELNIEFTYPQQNKHHYLPVFNEEFDKVQKHILKAYITDKDKNVISKPVELSIIVEIYKSRCSRSMW